METVLVAKALVIDGNGDCLVLRRSKTHPDSALKPDLPGGQIDEGETISQAISREIAEETGLRIESERIHILYATTDATRGKNFIRFTAAVRISEAKPKISISWEHDSSEWVPLDQMTTHMDHPEYVKGIEHILRYNLLDDIV